MNLPAVRRKKAQMDPFLADQDKRHATQKARAAELRETDREDAAAIWARRPGRSVNAVAGQISAKRARDGRPRHKDTIRKNIKNLKPASPCSATALKGQGH